jgi:glycosyltransferase involved in cell wall biosynthesis
MSMNLVFDPMLMINENINLEKNELPFVSICTPTFNRRPFIPYIKKCFENQTYPKEKMEWIIIDDGFDPVGDLFEDIPQVKYFYFPEHMTLGKKRNLMHTKCSGDIIVYMDDDDYYPPERVSHAVEKLMANPTALVAGSSEMHIYFDSIKSIMQFGPYGPNHSTAATFAFKKEALLITSYDDNALLAEEKQFLKNYTIPFVQLNTLKTILVFSHKHNSLNKDKMLENPEMSKASPSKYNIFHFMKDQQLINFYIRDMNQLLEYYDPGNPKYKPLILEEIKKVEEKQKSLILVSKKMNEFANKYKTNTISLETIIIDYEKIMDNKNFIISELIKKNKMNMDEIKSLKLNVQPPQIPQQINQQINQQNNQPINQQINQQIPQQNNQQINQQIPHQNKKKNKKNKNK